MGMNLIDQVHKALAPITHPWVFFWNLGHAVSLLAAMFLHPKLAVAYAASCIFGLELWLVRG